MNQNDKTAFAKLIYGLGEYYGKQLATGVVDLYWQGLRSYSLDDVRRAVNSHVQDPDSGQFMPKIADLNRALAGGKQSQAMVAWSKVDKAVRRIGPYESVTFDDPIINRVLDDMGGWIYLCDVPSEKDLEFKMHEFSKRYQGYVAQGGVSEYPSRLIGKTEAHNSKEGYETKPPVLVGDHKRAQLVYEKGSHQVGLPMKRAESIAGELADRIMLVHSKESA